MKKIMIVDDEPDQIFTMKMILEQRSDEYELIGANDGLQCLHYLKNGEIPDLIFMDIMMPKLNGWELFEKIKQNHEWKNIPIVFLTARTDDTAVKAGKFLGDDFLNKPVDTHEVFKIIEEKTTKK